MRNVNMLVIVIMFVLAACERTEEDSKDRVLEDSTVAIGADVVPSQDQADGVETPIMRLTYEQRKGSRLYRNYCAVCHGDEGKGDGFNSFNLDPRPRDLTDASYMGAYSDELLVEFITQGGSGVNKSVLMPAWGHTLTRKQIEDIVEYVRIFSRKGS